ncbi:pantoate kinase [Halosegnis sp.]|uniref:pantoate kinase n=1 Tax=Halosegnis sp. TaxID=2864959 RepID=UPI0035D4C9C2
MPAATAFVPGHVTGFFAPAPDEDPARAGSRGGGVALSDGVTVTVEPGSGLTLGGAPTRIEPVERVLTALGVEARISCETPLPLGAGFGVSGAVTLGTALAATAAFGLERSENDLVGLAHRAEVESGTGLGDVVAQARGGLPLRTDAGAPGHGSLDGIPARSRVEYLSLGELSTADTLAGETDALATAGDRALSTVRETPTPAAFVAASRQFAESVDLLTDDLRSVLTAVDEAGGTASMAMLGETAFCLGTGLSAAGYDPSVCEIAATGARLIDVST